MKRKLFKPVWLLVVLILFATSKLHGQQHIGIAAGFGFPESFHLGLRYHWSQSQVGVYYGQIGNWQSTGASLGYHIFGSSSHTPIKPGYLKAGIFHTRIDGFMFWDEFKFSSLGLRGGYTLNFSKRAGFELEAGPSLLLHMGINDMRTNVLGIGFGFGGRFFLRL
jgi:hypothetical protein